MHTHPTTTPARTALWAVVSAIAPPSSDLRTLASDALGQVDVPVNSDEHARVLDRVARARCAEWLDREHGMDQGFAREVVDKILDIYTDSTTVRR